ncbi:MAG: hypothetical protein RID91_22430 [Azospirillaceae bacterium]
MAYLLITYDLPPTDRMFRYSEEALVLLRHFADTPGYVRVIGMRAPDNSSPSAVVAFEYDTLDHARAAHDSKRFAEDIQSLRDLGCTDITVRVLDQSPLIPRR